MRLAREDPALAVADLVKQVREDPAQAVADLVQLLRDEAPGADRDMDGKETRPKSTPDDEPDPDKGR